MRRYLGPVVAICWKDILLEARSKDILVTVSIFSLLVVVIFNFAVEPNPRFIELVAPGVIWIAIMFGGTLGIIKSFTREKEQGNIHALMLAPVGRDAVFFGKMLANFLFMLIVEVIVFPVSILLFNLSFNLFTLVPAVFFATLGIAIVGTVFSAMAANTRVSEVIMPLLFFPAAVPLLIAAVEISGMVIRGDQLSTTFPWLPFLVAYDAIFIVVCPMAFKIIVED